MSYRVGFGYDVHRLTDGRPFVLGGVEIPYEKGLAGHSDADVLIHAICDALLGAAALKDIGYHFPDTDQQYKSIDSKKLLAKVVDMLANNGYSIGNIDTTVVCELPKINPHTDKICSTLSEILNVNIGDVSVKATTNETMGFAGRKEGVVAYAIAAIYKNK
jgi:2-C-methyl-D-erythritol 2,4-cyclodiphosphate synthase